MKHWNVKRGHALMLLLPLVLMTGCGGKSQTLPPVVVAPPAIPPLPAQARQPMTPSECSPTCLSGLTAERESWLKLLTPPAPPASPVNELTTR